jgi:hypothetical protein
MSSEKDIKILSCGSSEANAEERYSRWHSILESLDPPWGMKGVERKPKKTSLAGWLGATYRVGKGVKSFGVDFYQGRHDEDDVMGVSFNIQKFLGETKYLWDVVLPKYIEAMDAYNASVQDADLLVRNGENFWSKSYDEREAIRLAARNPRDQLKGIWQVNYWADQQCRNYFGISAEAVVSKLQGHVANVKIFRGGAYFVCSYDAMTCDEVAMIEPVVRRLLE